MNKIKIFFILIFVQSVCYSQVGQIAAKIAVDIGEATLPTSQIWLSINSNQQAVKKHSESIAIKTASILVLKKDYLDSLTKEPDGLKETTHWKQSLVSIENIYLLNANTFEIMSNFPEVKLPIATIGKIAVKAEGVVEDIVAVAKAGKNNRMTPTGRYKLIKNLNKRLQIYVQLSKELNDLAQILALLVSNPKNPSYNYSVPIQNTLDKINSFVID